MEVTKTDIPKGKCEELPVNAGSSFLLQRRGGFSMDELMKEFDEWMHLEDELQKKQPDYSLDEA